MTRRGAIAAWLAAAAALGYFGLMVVTGAMPVQRQLVRTEAAGVLTAAPESIRRVELARGEERVVVRRVGETEWAREDGATLAADASAKLSRAVQMLHRSAPVREMTAEELAGVDRAPFELERPRIVATLFEGDGKRALTARFGAHNAEDFLQYMTVQGDPRVYLMSRFIGAEWSAAMDAVRSP